MCTVFIKQTVFAVALTAAAFGQSTAFSAEKKGIDLPCVTAKNSRPGVAASSVVLDRKCERVVAPFELTENMGDLACAATEATVKKFNPIEKLKDLIGGVKGQEPKDEGSISPQLRLAAQQMNWLPMSTERMIGAAMHKQQKDVLSREEDPAVYERAEQILKEVLASIKEPHEYEFKIFVLGNGTRNALAQPGGYLYIDYPLVNDENYRGKAYFAIAHEIAHVLQRHETRAAQARIIDSVAIQRSGIAGLLKTVRMVRSGGENEGLLKIFLAKELFAQFHSQQELQSDACAVRMLSTTLPERSQLIASLTQFIADLPKPEQREVPKAQPGSEIARTGAAIEGIITWAETPIGRHPTTQERAAVLNETLAEMTKPASAAIGR